MPIALPSSFDDEFLGAVEARLRGLPRRLIGGDVRRAAVVVPLCHAGRLPAGSVKRSPACQTISVPPVAVAASSPTRVVPVPRITKKSWLVALASVMIASPGQIWIKLAQSPGEVAGPGQPRIALLSSGTVRVIPCSCSWAANRAPGIAPSVPSAIGLEA